jgi:hypothetical protein
VLGLSARAAVVTERSGKWRGVALVAGLVSLGGAGGLWALSRRPLEETGVLAPAKDATPLAVSGSAAGSVGVGESAADAGAEPLPARGAEPPTGAPSVQIRALRAGLESESHSRTTPSATSGREPGAGRRRSKSRPPASTGASRASSAKSTAPAGTKPRVDPYDLP